MLTTQPVIRLALDSGRVTDVVMGSGELIAARKGVLLEPAATALIRK